MIAGSDSEFEEEPYAASDDENYVPVADACRTEMSDIEDEQIVEQAEISDSELSDEDQPSDTLESKWTAKDNTEWRSLPSTRAQTLARNIIRGNIGPRANIQLFTPKELFHSIITPEMCTIILEETNRKGVKVCDAYNMSLIENFPNAARRPPPRTFTPFSSDELDAFLGILIAAGVHRNNKENLQDMWKPDALPITRAAMSRDRFKMMLRFIRFDDERTRAQRSLTDKAAAIREIWSICNANLEKMYQPHDCITIDEQLFPFRGHTKFTQYIPSKPAKYGIKVFWACDAETAYPLQGELYTGKPTGGARQVNVGEQTVLRLVSKYKGSGRNVTTDNFFTTLQLAKTLASWKMTLVGTVRKNKRFLPANMQPTKERPINSTNFAFGNECTVCSYVPKKNKAVILLSSMHMAGEIEDTIVAKPEIIKYYNKTKGGVDTMDKMLAEYTVKRRTLRWPLAFFYNIIDVAGLASYILYRHNNPRARTPDQRRIFLKELAHELCLPSVEKRSSNRLLMRNHFLKAAVEMVLGRRAGIQPAAVVGPKQPHGSRGPTPVAGRCVSCRDQSRKSRKTRKSCVICLQPVCDEHSVAKTTCLTCEYS